MKMAKRPDRSEGLSLVELLLTLGIFSLAVAVVAGVVFAAQSSTKLAHQWGDRTQQLRVAMNQMGEDLSYGNWCMVCHPGGGSVLRVDGWQVPMVDKSGWDEAWADWPGYVLAARSVVVEYQLEEDRLVRTVYDGVYYANNSSASPIYSKQTLAGDLIPNANPDGSYFMVDADKKLAKAVLRTLRMEAGVNSIAEVSGQWYVPEGL